MAVTTLDAWPSSSDTLLKWIPLSSSVPQFMPDDRRHASFLTQRFERPPHKIDAADDVARMIDENRIVTLRRMTRRNRVSCVT